MDGHVWTFRYRRPGVDPGKSSPATVSERPRERTKSQKFLDNDTHAARCRVANEIQEKIKTTIRLLLHETAQAAGIGVVSQLTRVQTELQ